MTRPDECMFFAAGLGTRMRPLTDTLPKPLVPVSGRPLMDHSIEHARSAGIRSAVANVHHHAAKMMDYLADVTAPKITISDERAQLMDTGGGLHQARLNFTGPAIFTANPDAIWVGGNPFVVLADNWDPEKMDALLLTGRAPRIHAHKGSGDFFCDGSGRLSRRGDAPHAPDVYISAQIIKLSVIEEEHSGVFSLNRVWDRLIARGTLFGTVFPGHWVDVGHPEAIATGATLLAGAS